jgi:hypothetical protein
VLGYGQNSIQQTVDESTQRCLRVAPVRVVQEKPRLGDRPVRDDLRVSGNFPGSPVDLRYRFGLERGLIASLEITA